MVGIPLGVSAVRSNFALNHSRRERNFWMQRRSARNRHSSARTPAETKIREMRGRKSAQKRPIWRRAGNVWARTGDPPPSHRTESPPKSGTEISDAETGGQKSAFYPPQTRSQTKPIN